MDKSYIEILADEVLRPTLAAFERIKDELSAKEGFGIPNNPKDILHKAYEELSDWEIVQLIDIYHMPGETTPCAMCKWMLENELSTANDLDKIVNPKNIPVIIDSTLPPGGLLPPTPKPQPIKPATPFVKAPGQNPFGQ